MVLRSSVLTLVRVEQSATVDFSRTSLSGGVGSAAGGAGIGGSAGLTAAGGLGSAGPSERAKRASQSRTLGGKLGGIGEVGVLVCGVLLLFPGVSSLLCCR